MPKRKPKTSVERFLRAAPTQAKQIPKYMVPALFIVVLSVAVLLTATVRSFSTTKACVNAPTSAYPSLQVIVQKGSDRTEKTVTNRHVISCISDDLLHLPVLPSEGVICPKSDGSTYILSFDGGRIVTGSLSGCQAVKIQGDDKIYYLLPDVPYTNDMRSKLQKIVNEK